MAMSERPEGARGRGVHKLLAATMALVEFDQRAYEGACGGVVEHATHASERRALTAFDIEPACVGREVQDTQQALRMLPVVSSALIIVLGVAAELAHFRNVCRIRGWSTSSTRVAMVVTIPFRHPVGLATWLPLGILCCSAP